MASNHNSYWERREEEALKHYLTEEVEYQKRIDEIYADMLDGCQSEIDRFYRKYADDEGISLTEAQKRISRLDIEAYERKAQRYVADAEADRRINGGKTNGRGYYFSTTANAEMKLYNATMKINRLEMLKANIGLELIKGTAELETFMGDILQGRTEDELKRQAGILGDTIRDNARAAHSIVNASFHNATFSERLWGYHTTMKADLSKLLQQGLIQGKGNRELARELQQYFIGDERLKNGKKGAKYAAETLMRTELARVQTSAQKLSFERMGFDEYTFHANSGCCGDCQALNGKPFKVEKMMPGENAAPLHPRCRCSASAYSDRKEYDEWLDFLSKGGTTEEWNLRKQPNLAKAIDSMYLMGSEHDAKYKREEVLQELQSSPVGKDTIRAIRDSNARIEIYDTNRADGARGEQFGDRIRIFSSNIKSLRVAGQTLIHEMAHYRFDIGGCQHAEAICFAMEKMHIMGRDYLTKDEWEYVKGLAISNYPEYNWEKGGYGNYEQFSFVKDDE